MARFLSPGWFEALGQVPVPGTPVPPGAVTIEVVVTGPPEGDVRYQVVVSADGAGARWRVQDLAPAQVRFTTDYGTASAIADGRLAAVDALAQGRARVSGNAAALGALAQLPDLVPAALRATTTF